MTDDTPWTRLRAVAIVVAASLVLAAIIGTAIELVR